MSIAILAVGLLVVMAGLIALATHNVFRQTENSDDSQVPPSWARAYRREQRRNERLVRR